LTLDSTVLGLAHRGVVGTVLVFERKLILEDAIGSHACSPTALTCMCSIYFILGVHSLPAGTVNSVQTLKVFEQQTLQRTNHDLFSHSVECTEGI
jgi:hypothetical protein